MSGDLFERCDDASAPLPTMLRAAELSPCETYRFRLERTWGDGGKRFVVCMLNPSRADASIDDPTILRLIAFGRTWGHDGFDVVNLYPFRSPSPANLDAWIVETLPSSPAARAAMDRNLEHILSAASVASLFLAAWGAHAPAPYVDAVRAKLIARRVTLHCLGLTKAGAPKHPLARGVHRIPNDQTPIRWR